MNNKIKGLLVEPGKLPKAIEINNTIEDLQKLVGGYIEILYEGEVCLIVNEEGKLIGLPINRYFNHDILVGNILIFGHKNGDLISLTEKQTRDYKLFFGSKSLI